LFIRILLIFIFVLIALVNELKGLLHNLLLAGDAVVILDVAITEVLTGFGSDRAQVGGVDFEVNIFDIVLDRGVLGVLHLLWVSHFVAKLGFSISDGFHNRGIL
jgi:hypothetical protein